MEHPWITETVPAFTPVSRAADVHTCPYCHERIVGLEEAREHIEACFEHLRHGYRLEYPSLGVRGSLEAELLPRILREAVRTQGL